MLTDGGVYDNLGLETVWKRYETILVSDGGGTLGVEEHPKDDWPRHAYRVLFLIDSQVRALRKRQLIDAFRRGARTGAYWGVRSNLAAYGFADSTEVPREKSVELASVPTRLEEPARRYSDRAHRLGPRDLRCRAPASRDQNS